MILDKVLILKGLGGLTALGGTAAAAYFGISSLGGDSDAKALKKDLGLHSDCNLPSSGSTTCTLDADKLKAIKFDGKQENPTITVNGTVTLKIDKTSDTTTYPKGYKFTFENTNDLSIPKTSSSDVISIKKGTNTEFKIKETAADGGAKTLSLEKAWTVTKLAEKVGLTNCSTTNSTKECTLPTEAKLKLYISNNSDDKIENGKVSSDNQKLTYEEDAADHNQGFKFTTSADISLSEPDGKKIEASTNSGNPSYEIKEIDGQWYLAKKTTANAS